MKKINLIIFCCFIGIYAFSQCEQQCDFESSTKYNCSQFFIDTISNPKNIWEIGKSQTSETNVIATGLDSFYPVNDTSSFYYYYKVPEGYNFGGLDHISGKYKIDADSNDFGNIEVYSSWKSKWIRAAYPPVYGDNTPFTGKSDGWVPFLFGIGAAGFDENIDTLKIRFTFVSDSILEEREGWMLDDLEIEGWCSSSIKNVNGINNSLTVVPNPLSASSKITLADEFYFNGLLNYSVINMQGQTLIQKQDVEIENIIFHRNDFDVGLYLLLINDKIGHWSQTRFIVN